MRLIVNDENVKLDYSLEKSLVDGRILYFDIETTGLSPLNSMIYLIGAGYYSDNYNYKVIQWFADNAIDEEMILESFIEFTKDFKYLVSYNGDAFDIQFIKKRLKYLNSHIQFNITSIDLYKTVKSIKNKLKLNDCKLKTVEMYLGNFREDEYLGGQLIDVYRKYLISKSNSLESILLLHNYEDIIGLIKSSYIYYLSEIFSGNFIINEIGQDKGYINISCKIPYRFLKDISIEKEYCQILIRNKELTLKIPLLEETLKYFYENFKDYYYLISEDEAIHKSVAQFVDKDNKRKANKNNCYKKLKNTYLFSFGFDKVKQFKKDCKDRDLFIRSEDILNGDDLTLKKEYVIYILNY